MYIALWTIFAACVGDDKSIDTSSEVLDTNSSDTSDTDTEGPVGPQGDLVLVYNHCVLSHHPKK